ncbi:hypothetical protein EGY05_13700 [Chryseobacterium arthrosphaerae]|uniref:hypothetical protein n=1 Tax=Chryseobacterium arthrosphaerae TaxID=651561 RepID=UPI000F4D4F53|nr:hypothetical protein [Chryseobacterium arthrosphaerae]AYZ12916.1 hypothetical protein EGY05_13700 [Chryseobacterium arthrosphaerae]
MIIEELLNTGVCFAVIQSNSYLTKAKMMLNQEFEIIALEKDSKELIKRFTRNEGFHIPESQKNPKGIISYLLNLREIGEFKRLKEENFKKVVDDENGRVWEITGNSFKEYRRSSKRKALRNVS